MEEPYGILLCIQHLDLFSMLWELPKEPLPSTASSMMVGRVFLVLTGACQFGHGVGGFTTNFIHSAPKRTHDRRRAGAGHFACAISSEPCSSTRRTKAWVAGLGLFLNYADTRRATAPVEERFFRNNFSPWYNLCRKLRNRA